jgi:hypothetical protein
LQLSGNNSQAGRQPQNAQFSGRKFGGEAVAIDDLHGHAFLAAGLD